MEVAADRPADAVNPVGSQDHIGSQDRTRRRLIMALAVALCGSIVAAVLLGTELARAASVDNERAAAVHAARQFTANFTTIDFRTFDRDAGRVRAMASGDFAKQYKNATAKLKELVTANKTVTKGKVLDAGVASFDPDSARVLVVADSEVANVGTSRKAELRTYRLQLDLVRSEGSWSVVDLQFVG